MGDSGDGRHPRDAFITIFGRKPVLEAIADDSVAAAKLWIDRRARGEVIDRIEGCAKRRGLEPRRVSAEEVTRISRNARQDQGVALDVAAPRMDALDAWLDRTRTHTPLHLFVVGGVTNPVNVGMILRSALAAGIDGVVLPRAGVPEVGPLVIKASAGTALRAPILRTPTLAAAVDALRAARFELWSLRGDGEVELAALHPLARAAFFLGSESAGLSEDIERQLDRSLRIDMENGVESLNVAVAAALLAFRLRGGR